MRADAGYFAGEPRPTRAGSMTRHREPHPKDQQQLEDRPIPLLVDSGLTPRKLDQLVARHPLRRSHAKIKLQRGHRGRDQHATINRQAQRVVDHAPALPRNALTRPSRRGGQSVLADPPTIEPAFVGGKRLKQPDPPEPLGSRLDHITRP